MAAPGRSWRIDAARYPPWPGQFIGTDVGGRRAYGCAENLLIMALTCENAMSSLLKGADGKAGVAAEIGRDLVGRESRIPR
jgi:hypothetical protein